MSEETTPAKKAPRKTGRKKSAAKRTSKKSAKSDSSPDETELPLVDPGDSSRDSPETPKFREPKTGVRDARRETADEPISPETAEKLAATEAADAKPSGKDDHSRKRENSGEKAQDQGSDRDNPDGGGDRRGRGRNRSGRDRNEKRDPKPRLCVDTKDLSKKAWKIFLSEVTEEGLALLDDNGLRDYARSSFNAARLFLEEKDRMVMREKQAEAEQKRREKARKKQDKEDD